MCIKCLRYQYCRHLIKITNRRALLIGIKCLRVATDSEVELLRACKIIESKEGRGR